MAGSGFSMVELDEDSPSFPSVSNRPLGGRTSPGARPVAEVDVAGRAGGAAEVGGRSGTAGGGAKGGMPGAMTCGGRPGKGMPGYAIAPG